MKIVLDTNVVLRGLANPSSFSGRLLEACDQRKVLLLLSKSVIDEYRVVLTDEQVMERRPVITPEAVEMVLRRLRYVSDYLRRVSARFKLARDPRDEKFIELAISGTATHIISCDMDLLSLPSGRTDDAKRFRQRLPRVAVVEPQDFVRGDPELFP